MKDGKKVSEFVEAKDSFEIAEKLKLDVEKALSLGDILFWSWIHLGERCSFAIMPTKDSDSPDLELELEKDSVDADVPNLVKAEINLN